MKKLSIIIPVYNEISTVDSIIRKVLNSKIPNYKIELIVVDDGSTDGTSEKLSVWRQKCSLIRLSENKGKGAALRAGFKIATGDTVLVQDADLEYNPDDYVKLLEPFENSRVYIVYGSRFLGSHLSTLYWYTLGNKLVTFVTNVLYNTNLTDMETGYKVFRKSVLLKIKLKANRFDFEPEFTAKVLKAGFQIYEVPISYYGRKFSEGKKLTWRDGIYALLTLIKYKFSN